MRASRHETNCTLCDRPTPADRDEMIDAGWIAYYYEGRREIPGPVCPGCRTKHLRVGEDCEWERIAPPTMTTYYVATLARYVLVDAEDESEARRLAQPALHALYADERERLGKEVPIEIRTVREAMKEEIDFWNWHHEMMDRQS